MVSLLKSFLCWLPWILNLSKKGVVFRHFLSHKSIIPFYSLHYYVRSIQLISTHWSQLKNMHFLKMILSVSGLFCERSQNFHAPTHSTGVWKRESCQGHSKRGRIVKRIFVSDLKTTTPSCLSPSSILFSKR